jgi:hypothetical protein
LLEYERDHFSDGKRSLFDWTNDSSKIERTVDWCNERTEALGRMLTSVRKIEREVSSGDDGKWAREAAELLDARRTKVESLCRLFERPGFVEGAPGKHRVVASGPPLHPDERALIDELQRAPAAALIPPLWGGRCRDDDGKE